MTFLGYTRAHRAQEALLDAHRAALIDAVPNETWFILPSIKVFVARVFFFPYIFLKLARN